MELRIDINNCRKQFTGISRDDLCDFQYGVKYQFPYPVRYRQLESTRSGFAEEFSVRHQGDSKKNQRKCRLPIHIEHVTRQNQKHLAPLIPLCRDSPVDNKDKRKYEPKIKGGKGHCFVLQICFIPFNRLCETLGKVILRVIT